MSGLSLSMLISITSPICDVFNKTINNIVQSNHVKDLPLLCYILNKTVVPDSAFKCLAESVHSSVDIISCLISHRLWWDKKVENIVKLLKQTEYKFLSCTEIDRLLTDNRIQLSLYEKHCLFTLLTKRKSKSPLGNVFDRYRSYNCEELFPIENISLNHVTTESLIDEVFLKTAELADHIMLKNITTAALDNDLQYRFQPEENTEHKRILSWLQHNISKGCSGDQRLGWSEGPDSAKWPATELKDYVKTLDRLYEIMS